MTRIPLWIDLRGVPNKRRIPYLRAAKRVEAEALIVAPDDPETDRDDAFWIEEGRLMLQGIPAGRHIVIEGARDQAAAMEAEGIVLVEGKSWSIIPLENLIAARRDRPGTLYALADTPERCGVFRDTLEHGVHGVVLAPDSPAAIEAADRILREKGLPRPGKKEEPPSAVADTLSDADGDTEPDGGRQGDTNGEDTTARSQATDDDAAPAPEVAAAGAKHGAEADEKAPRDAGSRDDGRDKAEDDAPGVEGDGSHRRITLSPARITAIEDAGPGDRVCIDTTSLFESGEGLLVGSTARGFALVHAETIESEFVRARPFRVNAGAVHSYLFGPEGKTRYLSELQAGDRVLAVAADGRHRTLTVGRAKIERRPHTLIKWKGPEGEGSAVLQNAETIRLVSPEGTAISITQLRVGQHVLVHREDAARHFGMPVDEALEER